MNGKRYTNETGSARLRFFMTVMCIIAVIMVTVYFVGAQFRPGAEGAPDEAGEEQNKPEESSDGMTDAADIDAEDETGGDETDFKVYISFAVSPDTGSAETGGQNEPEEPDETGAPSQPNGDMTNAEDIVPGLPDGAVIMKPYVSGDIPVMSNHEHKWLRPTCDDPYVCYICGWTKGEALGHDWMEATCTVPKTCKRCGATEGEPAGHDWEPATCLKPETCSHCGEERGEVADHSWKKATCTKPKTCSVCGETKGEPLGHDWEAATCTEPETCSRCGKTQGKAAGHKWKAATTTSPSKCSVCGATKGDRLPNGIKVAAFSYTDEELDMLARLVYREAGSGSKDGMRAVATVVLNRVRSPYFGSTIKAVITAPGQFYGSLDNINAPSACYDIAKECLAGNLYARDILYFKSASSGKSWGGRTYCFSVGGNNFYT